MLSLLHMLPWLSGVLWLIRAGNVQGKRMVGEHDLRVYLDKWDKKYWATYKVLDILQKVFYRLVTLTRQCQERTARCCSGLC